MIYHETPSGTLHQGEVLDILRTLPDESVNCCVTSPPYWGLRDYGTAEWEGGDQECDHKQHFARNDGGRVNTNGFHGSATEGSNKGAINYRDQCPKCGAIRKDRQLGLERTPEEYVARMVDIFREVRRVLRKDGTLWLNLGDSYVSGKSRYSSKPQTIAGRSHDEPDNGKKPDLYYHPYLKDKDLCGIPWRVAFALQADGWYLRQDIIWHKPNPMPESVTDRCTKAHEYVFLMSKSAKYYYDNEAVKENTASICTRKRASAFRQQDENPNNTLTTVGRNKRSVWTVTTKPFKEAHFATFPRDLIRPMIQAGCPGQVCVKCGKPRERIMEYTGNKLNRAGKISDPIPNGCKTARHNNVSESSALLSGVVKEYKTTGHTDCGCNAGFQPGVVLDPFMGSGTTAIEAIYQGKRYIGIDLNPEYCAMAAKRIEVELDQTDLFRKEQ